MLIGSVVGPVVATVRNDALGPGTLLHIEACGAPVIAVDTVGAHAGQRVLVLTGAAAQQLAAVSGRCADALVVAIADGEDAVP